MKTKPKLDMDTIAKVLGAERRGEVRAASGYFGAMQVVAEIQSRFQAPAGGGRSTDPTWTDRRLVPLAPKTLTKLEHLASLASKKYGMTVSPLQVAALLIERATEEVDDGSVPLTEAAEFSFSALARRGSLRDCEHIAKQTRARRSVLAAA